jgi:hypothetical protein
MKLKLVRKSFIPSMILTLVLFTGCSWFSPGSVEDPGETVGAPTEPEVIEEGYEEGSDYPEENF